MLPSLSLASLTSWWCPFTSSCPTSCLLWRPVFRTSSPTPISGRLTRRPIRTSKFTLLIKRKQRWSRSRRCRTKRRKRPVERTSLTQMMLKKRTTKAIFNLLIATMHRMRETTRIRAAILTKKSWSSLWLRKKMNWFLDFLRNKYFSFKNLNSSF